MTSGKKQSPGRKTGALYLGLCCGQGTRKVSCLGRLGLLGRYFAPFEHCRDANFC
jgi:hypothetical protein